MKKILKLCGVLAFALVVLAVIAAVILEARFSVLRSAPRVDRLSVVEGPSIMAVVNPQALSERMATQLRERVGFWVPNWIVRRALPYEVTLLTASDYDDQEIDLTFFVNAPHFASAMVSGVKRASLEERFERIDWAADGVTKTAAGAFTVGGTVPMEDEAQETAWYLWKQSFKPAPMPVEGGHLVEVVMDNRDGGAYLAVASLLHALDMEPDPVETDISLSSLKFVTESHLFADVLQHGELRTILSIEIKPEAVKRLGVLNLKGGIDELMQAWAERLQERHEIGLTGSSRWDDNVMVFEYHFDSFDKVWRAALAGELL